MACAYSQVLIFCPEARTGGPEALHQLAYIIRQNGGTAKLVYTGPGSYMAFNEDRVVCVPGPESSLQRYFSAYAPVVPEQSRIDDKTLLVYPEIMALKPLDWPGKEFGARRAVWWLSVASAFHSNKEMADDSFRDKYFKDESIIHFYQSAHSREFLRANNAANFHPLFDFTDQDFIHQSQISSDFIPAESRDSIITFFPRKGGHLAGQFAKSADWANLGVKFTPIENMSKNEVRQTLFKTRIYIDFGQHPGKDRVPREAAIAGAIILLLRAGASKQFEDHPLDPKYIFNEEEIASGQLRDKVLDVIENSQEHYENQRIYRQKILLEREEFSHQVRSLFFEGLG